MAQLAQTQIKTFSQYAKAHSVRRKLVQAKTIGNCDIGNIRHGNGEMSYLLFLDSANRRKFLCTDMKWRCKSLLPTS